MIYEERFTHVSITKVREYVELCRDKTIPALKTAGGRTICLLSGLIGDRGNTFLQVTGFEDSSAWNLAQKTMLVERNDLIEQEEVRLLKPIASRPHYLPNGNCVNVRLLRARPLGNHPYQPQQTGRYGGELLGAWT